MDKPEQGLDLLALEVVCAKLHKTADRCDDGGHTTRAKMFRAIAKEVRHEVEAALASRAPQAGPVCDGCGQDLTDISRGHWSVLCHKPGCAPQAGEQPVKHESYCGTQTNEPCDCAAGESAGLREALDRTIESWAKLVVEWDDEDRPFHSRMDAYSIRVRVLMQCVDELRALATQPKRIAKQEG